jgi:S1-C subfamily serine protease
LPNGRHAKTGRFALALRGDALRRDNPGKSGGPLIDRVGHLVGVNTAIVSPGGSSAVVGFAIPIDTVNRIVPSLIRDGRAPLAGIGITTVPEEAAAHAGCAGSSSGLSCQAGRRRRRA